jgi:hypothetical protein
MGCSIPEHFESGLPTNLTGRVWTLFILQNYRTVFEIYPIWQPTTVAHGGWGLFVVRHGGKPNCRGHMVPQTPCAHGGRLPEPENCVKTIKINKKIFLVGDPLTAVYFAQNRDVTCSVWLEPQLLALRKASLATTLHNHMCSYSVSFLLILYLAEYKLLF